MSSGSSASSQAVRALYVHSPFCRRRCPYCDFAIALPREGIPASRFLDALGREIDRNHAAGSALRTVFVGGGTPTFLDPADLGRFFHLLHGGFDLSGVSEFSVEANPEDLDPQRVAVLAKNGVTRVSIGAQSFNSNALRMLGRRHRPQDVIGAVGRLREAGITAIGLDLIVAIPNQTREDAVRDVDTALSIEPDHISAYCLTYEEGTGMTGSVDRGHLKPHPPAEELARIHIARDRFEAAGLRRYEVSNYARPGMRCQHNLTYWRNRDHLGIGPGAVAYVGGVRRKNHAGLRAWCESLEAGEDPLMEEEALSPELALRETIMLGIRTRGGVSDRWLRARHGLGIDDLETEALARLRDQALITNDPVRLRLTARGFEVADAVAAELF